MTKIKILDVPINNVTELKAKEIILKWLDENKQRMVFTPNPEIIMEAQKDALLMKILNKADLVVPDGIGVVWASKYTTNKLKERVAGYDLVQNLFSEMPKLNKTVYFLGGGSETVKLAEKKMANKYKGLKIVGTHDGYFDEEEQIILIEQINKLKPDLLLVGLGAPKQEKWIYNNKDKLNVKVCIGVGGSFDGMAGKVKRAPKIFRRLGLEWFYRLISQPTRIKRMLQLPIFVFKILKKAYFRKE